ncbi:MAG: LPS export ABC transporter periplasmic protein LptC [Betaproteobacteria bacterium]|nr:LPS export ABC transporter periplasmic protein LptC [Betaproteobacteria bacterium]
MSDRPAIWFPLALLAVLALLTTWLDFQVRNSITERAIRGRHDPDTLLHNFVTRQTSAKGALELTLRARQLRHYMDDDSSALDLPVVEQLGAKGDTLTVRSERGKQGGTVKEPYTLETSYLKVLTESQRASTDRDVRIINARTQITGHGLDFDFKARTLTLRSNVRVTYLPPRKHAAPTPAPAKTVRRAAARAAR